MILLIDNYDSFVHNLARYFQRLGQETLVVRNDAIDVAEIRRLGPQALVLSPGPCTPSEAGSSVDFVREFFHELPMLGICLGHQTIATAFGAKIVRAIEPMHGRTSQIVHDESGIFANVPSPMVVCRYHSLIVEEATLSADFLVNARTSDGTIMGLQHSKFPVVGVQFHPEATLTEHGYQLLANFLLMAEIDVSQKIPGLADSEFRFADPSSFTLPSRPVTF